MEESPLTIEWMKDGSALSISLRNVVILAVVAISARAAPHAFPALAIIVA